MSEKTRLRADTPSPAAWVLGAIVFVGVAYSYRDSLVMLWSRWTSDPDYVHGGLVPLFSLWLLWARRGLLERSVDGWRWVGIPMLALTAAVRWFSAYWGYELAEPVSLLPCLAGIAALVGGRRVLVWAWPAIAFLVFMVPLPGAIAEVAGQPLQRIGTTAGTYVLQTLGVRAVSQGNVILLTDAALGVVEACNGLRMMMLFFAICTGAALISDRPIWERGLMIVSAVPIAIVANVARIVLTGVLHETVNHELANTVFHDLAGWFMGPLAVLLLWTEMALIPMLLTDPVAEGPLSLENTSAPGRSAG